MTNLSTLRGQLANMNGVVESVDTWRWRDRRGTFHRPANMATSYLFYTLRMIWNNVCPPWARVGNVRLYSFSAFYTRDYMAEAVGQLLLELVTRDDLTAWQVAELNEMFRHWSEIFVKKATVQPKLATEVA